MCVTKQSDAVGRLQSWCCGDNTIPCSAARIRPHFKYKSLSGLFKQDMV